MACGRELHIIQIIFPSTILKNIQVTVQLVPRLTLSEDKTKYTLFHRPKGREK